LSGALGYLFSSSLPFASLTNLSSSDELQALIWAILSPRPLPPSPLPSHPAQTSYTSTRLGYFFTAPFASTSLTVSTSPRRATEVVWDFFSPDPSLSPPTPVPRAQMSYKFSSRLSFHLSLHLHLPCHLSYSPDEQRVLVWAFFFTSTFTSTALSISTSPDERQALVWAVFSPDPSLSTPYHILQPRRATSAHLGYLFTSAFTSTSLSISTNPDERQALVWAVFSPDPSLSPPYKRSLGLSFYLVSPFLPLCHCKWLIHIFSFHWSLDIVEIATINCTQYLLLYSKEIYSLRLHIFTELIVLL